MMGPTVLQRNSKEKLKWRGNYACRLSMDCYDRYRKEAGRIKVQPNLLASQ